MAARNGASLAISLLLCSFMVSRAHAVTFADGGIHTIDASNSFPFEGATVSDGPRATGTTLTIADGGEFGGPVSAGGSSLINVIGGSNPNVSVVLNNQTVMTVVAGSIGQIDARLASRVQFLGGVMNQGVTSQGTSKITISAGTFMQGVFVTIDAELVMVGGSIGTNLTVAEFAFARLFGGSIAQDLEASQQSRTIMYGGQVGRDVRSSLNGRAEIVGGQIQGELVALMTSTIVVIGTDFNFPYGDIAATSGTLTGTLFDGTPIAIDFTRDPTATITLPEPNAGLASRSGALLLALLYRCRRSATASQRP